MAIVGRAMPIGGRKKAGDWRLEDRKIYQRGHKGHGDIKWSMGSGRWNMGGVQSTEMHCCAIQKWQRAPGENSDSLNQCRSGIKTFVGRSNDDQPGTIYNQ
jgi:hypothetical protein